MIKLKNMDKEDQKMKIMEGDKMGTKIEFVIENVSQFKEWADKEKIDRIRLVCYIGKQGVRYLGNVNGPCLSLNDVDCISFSFEKSKNA